MGLQNTISKFSWEALGDGGLVREEKGRKLLDYKDEKSTRNFLTTASYRFHSPHRQAEIGPAFRTVCRLLFVDEDNLTFETDTRIFMILVLYNVSIQLQIKRL